MIRFLLFLAAFGSPLVAADAPARAFHLPSLYHVGYWVRDLAKSRAFYHDYLGFEEPYDLRFANGTLQMVVMKVNERQVIYLFPNASKIKPNGDNLDHLGLETDNAAALYEYLRAKGMKTAAPHRGHIGDLLLGVFDPDGHPFEATQFEPEGQLLRHQGQNLPAGRISSHLRSASLTVADLGASRRFYTQVLGFREIGPAGGPVRVQVPDGADFLELLPASASPRAVPEYRLEVADAAKTAANLAARAAALGISPPSPPSTGPDGRRQTSCLDPDGTRVVFAE